MKIKKLLVLLTYFLLLLPVCLYAQTAAELEGLLGTPKVTCGQAAWFVYSSGTDNTGNIQNAEAAFKQAVEAGWLEATAANDPITLGKLSFLIMQAFKIKGGMMYSLLPGPRYAYRSMVSHSYIEDSSDPAMTVSGERFLLILGKVLNAEGDEQ